MKSLLFFSFLLAPVSALAVPITVRVVDEAGASIAGATVQVNRFDEVKPPIAVETTDAQGLAKYELGAASFSADFFGQAVAWKAGHALSGGYLQNLKDGTLILKLGAATSISGSIQDAAGTVEGASVQLKQAIVGNQALQLEADSPLAQEIGALSDSKGQFTLQGVPANAPLELSVSGEKYATQIVQTQSGAAVKVNLRPGAALRGQVVGTNGAPLVGLVVYVQNQAGKGSVAAQALTNADGSYRFDGLEAGTYNVMFRPAPDAEFVIAAREGALAVAGESRDLKTARAVAGVLVRGRVVDADSKAGVAGIGVSVYGPAQPQSSGDVRSVTTDKDGNFSARVVPGANLFSVRYVPQQWVRPQQKFELNIGADAPAQPLTFELTPQIPLRGRFLDEAGNGVQADLVLKQDTQEWPLQPDENGNFEVYTPIKGEVTLGHSMFAAENEDEDEAEAAPPPWEAVRGGTFTLPSTEPIQIVVRRAPVGALSGSVEDETGAPIEGVKLNVAVNNGEGVGSTSRWKTVASDAQGRFNLPHIRTDQTVKLRGIEKTGYDLQSGGAITRDGQDWTLQTVILRTRHNQLSGRVTLADGSPAVSALIFAAGSETRADADGAYVLPVLPSGNADVFVYCANQFGFRSAQTSMAGDAATPTASPTDIKLAPQVLQSTDRELAGEMFARARVLAAQTNADNIGNLKLRDADPVASLESLMAAPVDSRQMSFEIYKRAGDPDVSTPLLLRAVRSSPDAVWRLYGAMLLFAKRPDWPDDEATRELAASLSRDAAAIAADENVSEKWGGAIALVGIAPLIERYEGQAVGAAAMARGIAWTKARFPQPGDGNTGGYSSMLAAGAETIAANSPALFAQLLQAIDDPISPAYTRSMQEGIAAIAKTRGLEVAAPFLRQLSDAPNPNADGPGATMNYAARQTTRQAIEAGGAKNPALALQLARGLSADTNQMEDDDESARALAEAAFFQTPDVAASLWKESLPQLSATGAAQIAVRVAATRPELGAELLEIARQKLDASDEVNSWGNSVVAAFAFYEAKLDAARALSFGKSVVEYAGQKRQFSNQTRFGARDGND